MNIQTVESMEKKNTYIIRNLLRYLLNEYRIRNEFKDSIKVSQLISEKELDDLIFYIYAMEENRCPEGTHAQNLCEQKGIVYKDYFRTMWKLFNDWFEQEIEMIHYQTSHNLEEYGY